MAFEREMENEALRAKLEKRYPTMRLEEKGEHVKGLSSLLFYRMVDVRSAFGMYQPDIQPHQELELMSFEQYSEAHLPDDGIVREVYQGDLQVGQTLFGIKDNLEPITEYIAKIRESEAYREFVCKNFYKMSSKELEGHASFLDRVLRVERLEAVKNAVMKGLGYKGLRTHKEINEVLKDHIEITYNEKGTCAIDVKIFNSRDNLLDSIEDRIYSVLQCEGYEALKEARHAL